MQECPEVRVGEKLIVRVENVFGGGMVVCYQNKAGLKARGALLMPPASCNLPTFFSGEKDLANPVSLLHDHPYGNLDDFAEHLTVNVPGSVLDHWNSPSRLPGGNSITIGNRRQKLVSQIQQGDINSDSRFCKWRASEHCRSTVIEVPVPNHSALGLSAFGRQAKRVASEKIKKNVADLNVKTSVKRKLSTKVKTLDSSREGVKNGTNEVSRSLRCESPSISTSSSSTIHLNNNRPSRRLDLLSSDPATSPTLSVSSESIEDQEVNVIEDDFSISDVNHHRRSAKALVKDFSIDVTRCRPAAGYGKRRARLKMQRMKGHRTL